MKHLLTKGDIVRLAKSTPSLKGADLAWDEPNKCIITLRPGITWEAADGNVRVKGFVYSDEDGDEWHTFAYFKDKLSSIEVMK